MGRYQHRKEHGVKRIIQRMERPKSTPAFVLLVKKARQASRLRNRVKQLTEEREERVVCQLKHKLHFVSTKVPTLKAAFKPTQRS